MRSSFFFRLSQSITLCSLVILFACSLSVSARPPQKRTWAFIADPNLLVTVTEVKHLQSDHWLRDVEIKVRNDTGRPIYYLNIGVVLPDLPGPVRDSRSFQYSGRYCFPLWWGMRELLHKKYAKPENLSIKPGESHIFKVPEYLSQEYENYLSKNQRSPAAAKNVLLTVRFVAFGDASGYEEGEYFSSPL